MAKELQGVRVAVLATDGFEQSELIEPRRALDEAGAKTQVVSPKTGEIRGWNHTDWGRSVNVDIALDGARAEDYDALLLPGGVMNPDKLRMNPQAVAFVKAFFDAGKPVAAICHGPWTVLEAGFARGRRRCRPTCAMPGRNGPTRKSASTATSSRAASPTTSRRSTARPSASLRSIGRRTRERPDTARAQRRSRTSSATSWRTHRPGRDSAGTTSANGPRCSDNGAPSCVVHTTSAGGWPKCGSISARPNTAT